MNPVDDFKAQLSRRAFINQCALGAAALATTWKVNRILLVFGV
jgi:hypothetical protein